MTLKLNLSIQSIENLSCFACVQHYYNHNAQYYMKTGYALCNWFILRLFAF